MNKTLLLLSVCVMMGLSALAQTRPTRALHLNLGVNRGVVNSYDNGTVPFHIMGTSTNIDPSISYAWKRFETHVEFRYITSTLTNPSGTCKSVDFNYDLIYRFYDSQSNRWHHCVGGNLEGFGDLRQIPELQNASTNLSIFGNLGAVWKTEFDFAYNKDKTHNWLTAYGKAVMPLVGMACRPNFSYVSDGIGEINPIQMLLGEHHTFATFFPGFNTTLGLRLNLKNGNCIAFDYRWDFVTTGKKDVYRYDNAFHSFNTTFMFNIFRK